MNIRRLTIGASAALIRKRAVRQLGRRRAGSATGDDTDHSAAHRRRCVHRPDASEDDADSPGRRQQGRRHQRPPAQVRLPRRSDEPGRLEAACDPKPRPRRRSCWVPPSPPGVRRSRRSSTRAPVNWCLSPAIYPPKGSYVFSTRRRDQRSDHRDRAFFFFREKGWKKFGLLASQDASGQDGVTDVGEALKLPENSGMQLVDTERYAASDVSATAQLTRIKAAGPASADHLGARHAVRHRVARRSGRRSRRSDRHDERQPSRGPAQAIRRVHAEGTLLHRRDVCRRQSPRIRRSSISKTYTMQP